MKILFFQISIGNPDANFCKIAVKCLLAVKYC